MNASAVMTAYDESGAQLSRDLPRWLLVLIALSIIGVVMMLFVWAQSIPGSERVLGEPGMFRRDHPITTIGRIVREPAKANLVARHVVLDGVPVLRVLGDYTFLVGTEEQNVLVVLLGEVTERQPEGTTAVRAGQIVRIYGTAQILRNAAEVEDLAILSPEQA